MTTILADSFQAALANLNGQEQRQVKITAFDLQTEPDRPGLQFHRIDKSKDANFWSVRVNKDIRIIVHKLGSSLALVYVGHHDDAYRWAERRRMEVHPTTGAMQIVEVRERVVEIEARADQGNFVFADPVRERPLFAALNEADLLSVGVPGDWLTDVATAGEDRFFEISPHLPQEAAEALLEYAATGALRPAAPPVADPMRHPDALRRFRIMDGIDELRAALDAPFERWAIFLHPAQRATVEREYTGPVRVVGSAGTGKTVVALHRVVRLLDENRAERILLTTFSAPLAQTLEVKLALLLGDRQNFRDRVTVASFETAAHELVTLATGHTPYRVDTPTLRAIVIKAAEELGVTEFSSQFLVSEWEHVIDAWQLQTLDEYAAVPRMGRKNRLGAKQRERLWRVFERVTNELLKKRLTTAATIFSQAAELHGARDTKPYDFIVVDEAQDLGVPELRFLVAISSARPDALFFAGDIGQRIFQQPYSWRGLGVDVRGRSYTLKVNYRTSHQIRRAADWLLPKSVRDVDGIQDNRQGTVSVFDGPEPILHLVDDAEAERAAAVRFLQAIADEGIEPSEIGIFVRSEAELPRARAVVAAAGLEYRSSTDRPRPGAALLGTMHLAKGLEFRAVLLIACDEDVLPLPERLQDVADEFELDEVMATERQLLYVAATRARDRLYVLGLSPGSEFLEDFRP